MLDVRYSQYIYLVPDEKGKGLTYQICVQRTLEAYRPALFGIAGTKNQWYGRKKFDSPEECQAYIDREAIANNWQRALITVRVLF